MVTGKKCIALLLIAVFGAIASVVQAADNTVNIYSYRQPKLIQPLLDDFTSKTGIKTNVIFAKKGLIERIAAEGANSPADVILTTGIVRLASAKANALTQPLDLNHIRDAVPAQFLDKDGHWVGLTVRARVIYASKERVQDEEISYESLSDPKWRGRICTRSGHHPYTLGVIASMVAHHGEDWTETWLEGVKANLARKPTGNDRAQVKAIYAGLCDIALGNTYYMGKMLTNKKAPEQREWANSVRIMFPNFNGRGSHVNISGAAVAKFAPHKEAAIKFLDYLVGNDAQAVYANLNFEYPVKAGVPSSDLVTSWGQLKSDPLDLQKIVDNSAAADRLVDKTRFDDGPSS